MTIFIADEELKTLADVAHSYADAPGPSSPTQEKPHKSLAEAAMAYQEHLSPPKSQPARVSVVTGEEEERNVLQVRNFFRRVQDIGSGDVRFEVLGASSFGFGSVIVVTQV